jgi:protein gp37
MTVIGTGISWTNSTWNPWVGCKSVSAGCDNCYARNIVNGARTAANFGHPFEQVKLHLDRLSQIGKFKPIKTSDGLLPHMVFVNSMSDFFLEDVPDSAIQQTLDAMETTPDVVYQVLSKRPIRARQIITARYGNRGVPKHIWFGFSAEDNRVAGRIKILRSIKDRVGDMVSFLSVEPIVGPTDTLDFTGVDWVITGGESGPRARTMERAWLMPAVEQALRMGIPLWHKQSGTMWSHPNLDRAPMGKGITARFQWLVDNGWELLAEEKGGATIDKATYRQLPAAFHSIAGRLNAGRLNAERLNAERLNGLLI